MEQVYLYIISLSLCILSFCPQSYSQSDTTMVIDNEVDTFKLRQKQLNNEIKQLQKRKLQLNWMLICTRIKKNSLESKLKKIEKKNSRIKNRKEYEKYESLTTKISSLQSKKIMPNFETEKKAKEKTVANSEYENLKKRRDQLDSVILSRFEPYLDMQYSEMNLDKLMSMENQLSKFAGSPKIDDFLNRLHNAISNKKCYDKAKYLLSVEYNESKIVDSIKKLKRVKCGVKQSVEISEIINILENYSSGLQAFSEFIKGYSYERTGIYNNKDFMSAVEYIYGKNDLKSRIEKYVLTIPYLSIKWDEYYKAIQTDFNAETLVEKEILRQSSNIKK